MTIIQVFDYLANLSSFPPVHCTDDDDHMSWTTSNSLHLIAAGAAGVFLLLAKWQADAQAQS